MNSSLNFPNHRGFTLLEMLFALAILGFLLLGAGILSMRYRERLQSLAEIQDLGAVRLAAEDWLVRTSPEFSAGEIRQFALFRDGDGMLRLLPEEGKSAATRHLTLSADPTGKPVLHCVYVSGSQEVIFLLVHDAEKNKTRVDAVE